MMLAILLLLTAFPWTVSAQSVTQPGTTVTGAGAGPGAFDSLVRTLRVDR